MRDMVEEGIRMGNVTLRDISRHEIASTVAPLVKLDATVEINRLVAENIYQTLVPGSDAPLWINEATIGHLIERNVEW